MVNKIAVIKDNDNLFEAIKYFSIKYLVDKSNSGDETDNYLDSHINYALKWKTRNKTYVINEKLSHGQYDIKYDNLDIVIIIKRMGNPLALECKTVYHEEMELHIENSEENNATLSKFLEDSGNYYVKTVLDKQKENKKTTVYVFDDYWETVEKRLNRKLSTVYLGGKETELYDNIKEFLDPETEEEFTNYGIPYKLNILLHGYPGTGKTSLIFSLASELGMDVALFTFTNKTTDADFMRAMRRLPDNTIVVFEDIDTLFVSRKKNDEFKNNISFSGLLNLLDGIAHIHKQIIFMTTNCFMVLDKALVRPGRVDINIEFKYATKKQMKGMFEAYFPKQNNSFKEFYTKVKNIRLTTAMLQQFFFIHRKDQNILDYIEELEKVSNENDYENNKEVLYT